MLNNVHVKFWANFENSSLYNQVSKSAWHLLKFWQLYVPQLIKNLPWHGKIKKHSKTFHRTSLFVVK